MFHFISGLYNTIFSEKELNILIIGHESSGKTTLLEQLRYMYDAKKQQQHHEQLKRDEEEQQRNEQRHLVLEQSDRRVSSSTSSIGWPSSSLPVAFADPHNRREDSAHEPAVGGNVLPVNDSAHTDVHDESHLGLARERKSVGNSTVATRHSFETDVSSPCPPPRPYVAPLHIMQDIRIRPTIGTNILHTTHQFAQHDHCAPVSFDVVAPLPIRSMHTQPRTTPVSRTSRTQHFDEEQQQQQGDDSLENNNKRANQTDIEAVAEHNTAMSSSDKAQVTIPSVVHARSSGDVESAMESSGGDSQHHRDSMSTTNKTNSINQAEDTLHTTRTVTPTSIIPSDSNSNVGQQTMKQTQDEQKQQEEEKRAFAQSSSTNQTLQHQITQTAATAALREQKRRQKLRTPILLWDLGGQISMRSLWDVYFSQCHAIIFVVDSSLPFTQHVQQQQQQQNQQEQQHSHKKSMYACADPPIVAVNLNTRNHFNRTIEYLSREPDGFLSSSNYAKHSQHHQQHSHNAYQPLPQCSAPHELAMHMRQAYCSHCVTLQRLFSHHALNDVPFLLLSNKRDSVECLSLAEMQEALGIADIALRAAFYDSAGCVNARGQSTQQNESSTDTATIHNAREEKNAQTEASSGAVSHSASSNRGQMHSTDTGASMTTLLSNTEIKQQNLLQQIPQNTHHYTLDRSISSSSSSSSVTARYNTHMPNADALNCVCGFGRVTYKLAEANALTGEGVAQAMDWLMTQLLRSARNTESLIN